MNIRTRLIPLVAGVGAVVLAVSGAAAASPASAPDMVRAGHFDRDSDTYSDTAPRSYLPGFVFDKGRYRAFDSPDPNIGLFPSGINNRGEITGEYLRPDGESGLLRDRRGRISSFDVPGAAGTEAVRINDRGQIVGEYSNDTPFVNDSADIRAYVTYRDRFIRLRIPRTALMSAFGINDRGWVVGTYVEQGTPRNPDGTFSESHGYLWKNGRFRTIDIPGAAVTELYEINNRGDMVGVYAERGTLEQHGFLLDRHGRISEIKVDGGQFTFPFGINDRRQVVGFTSDAGPDGVGINIHGFGFLKGVDGPLSRINFPGAPQTAALGINDLGQVVGAYENPAATDLQATTRQQTALLGAILPLPVHIEGA
jgi:uncharacterized membrane protein